VTLKRALDHFLSKTFWLFRGLCLFLFRRKAKFVGNNDPEFCPPRFASPSVQHGISLSASLSQRTELIQGNFKQRNMIYYKRPIEDKTLTPPPLHKASIQYLFRVPRASAFLHLPAFVLRHLLGLLFKYLFVFWRAPHQPFWTRELRENR
jgi:hypothetical protein